MARNHRSTLESLVGAWRVGDALRAAAHFSADGQYGEAGAAPLTGRDALVAHFTRFFRDGPRWRCPRGSEASELHTGPGPGVWPNGRGVSAGQKRPMVSDAGWRHNQYGKQESHVRDSSRWYRDRKSQLVLGFGRRIERAPATRGHGGCSRKGARWPAHLESNIRECAGSELDRDQRSYTFHLFLVSSYGLSGMFRESNCGKCLDPNAMLSGDFGAHIWSVQHPRFSVERRWASGASDCAADGGSQRIRCAGCSRNTPTQRASE